jgi:hypothetical protein
MKKIILLLFVSLFPLGIFAQDFATSFINKHGDKDLEVVSIGKQMLSMLEEMSSNDPELKEVIHNLNGIKIMTSTSEESAQKAFKEAYAMLFKKNSGFEEMMSVKEENEETYIMIRKKGDVIKDLVLLTFGKEQFNMICLTGNINVDSLAKLSSVISLNKLKKLKPEED